MSDTKNSTIELLSPAGNLEKMKTALAFGADAVYAGVPAFSLRTRINDFDMKAIEEAVEYVHKAGKKIYITLNIFAHNRHLDKAGPYIKELKRLGVDALIISDPGMLKLVQANWSEANIHLSTQANCTNWQSAQFWHAQGANRIILGREVTLKEINEIHRQVPDVELEYFVHGAMCMAYSGRCFLSKMYLDRSGNLGDCVQPCRWEYRDKSQIPNPKSQINSKFKIQNSKLIEAKGHREELELVEEEHGSYILNSKDLCLLKHLKDLKEAGVLSFKIEGRAKSVYYQAMIAGIYSRVTRNVERITTDEIDFLSEELETKLVHRGYTKGFLLGGKAEQNIENSHNECAWEFCGQVIETTEKGDVIVKVHNSLKVGDEIEIVRPLYDIIKMKVDKLLDAETHEEISEAHGGQGQMVILHFDEEIPVYSVIRRSLSNNKNKKKNKNKKN